MKAHTTKDQRTTMTDHQTDRNDNADELVQQRAEEHGAGMAEFVAAYFQTSVEDL